MDQLLPQSSIISRLSFIEEKLLKSGQFLKFYEIFVTKIEIKYCKVIR